MTGTFRTPICQNTSIQFDLNNTESEANPNNNLMLRQAELSVENTKSKVFSPQYKEQRETLFCIFWQFDFVNILGLI